MWVTGSEMGDLTWNIIEEFQCGKENRERKWKMEANW